MSLNNSCVRLLQLLDFHVSTLPPFLPPWFYSLPNPPPFPAIHNLGVQKHYSPLYQTLHAIFSDVFLNWCPSSTPVTFTHLAPSRLIIPLSLTLFSIPLFHHLPSPHINSSLFNQHLLNFNIQAHLFFPPIWCSISLHSLVPDSSYNIAIKRNNISHQPTSSPFPLHLSFPISPYFEGHLSDNPP